MNWFNKENFMESKLRRAENRLDEGPDIGEIGQGCLLTIIYFAIGISVYSCFAD